MCSLRARVCAQPAPCLIQPLALLLALALALALPKPEAEPNLATPCTFSGNRESKNPRTTTRCLTAAPRWATNAPALEALEASSRPRTNRECMMSEVGDFWCEVLGVVRLTWVSQIPHGASPFLL